VKRLGTVATFWMTISLILGAVTLSSLPDSSDQSQLCLLIYERMRIPRLLELDISEEDLTSSVVAMVTKDGFKCVFLLYACIIAVLRALI
jgi:hypothetical protein